MNRVIKFRAWDNVKNVMYYPGEEDLILFMLADEGFKVDEVIPDDSKSEGFYAERLEHLQFMQFTGLHDKNGVEIYEGDVYHMGDPNITYTVIWQDTGLKGKQNGSTSFAGLEHWQERIEIIGNIYENPELLEVKSC